MLVRGIRGATTVSQNTKEDIVKEIMNDQQESEEGVGCIQQ